MQTKPKINPFEVKMNKVKHTVVNKRVQKWEKGTPGVSRSKALNKRKDTLLREVHHMKKANTFHDKRIGENDSNLTADERMVQRFAIERKKQASRGDFSLKDDEEEVLTHYGQSLAENLQDTVGSDSEDEDDRRPKTAQYQFGGFSQDNELSWKDKMNEMIAESKKHKYERQAEKEKTLEATNELNTIWKTVVPKTAYLMNLPKTQKKTSNFMLLFRDLVEQQKSVGATDKTKTEEEVAKEEAEKLEKLEAERVSRMKESSVKKGPSHVTADDLSDGFALDKPKEKMVAFNIDKEKKETVTIKRDRFGNDIIIDNQEEEESNGEDESDNDNEDDDSDGDEEDDDAEEDDEDDEDEEDDKFSDLESNDESEEEGNEKELNDKKKRPTLKSEKSKIAKGTEKSHKDELPFTFSAPCSYQELATLLHGHSCQEQATIVGRLRACHHPSLAEGNKDKLESIHLYLLQYWGQLAADSPLDTRLITQLTPQIWEMSQMFKESTAKALQTYIVQRQSEHAAFVEKRGGRGCMPSVETILHLLLVDALFPTSDFSHPAATPALTFMSQILTEAPPKSSKDVYIGLLLCSIILKFVSLSKKYVPEVVTFLQGLLCLAIPSEKSNKDIRMFPPFKQSSKIAQLLMVETSCDTCQEEWSLNDILSKDSKDLDSDEFRCYAINTLLGVMAQYLELWEELPCIKWIVQPWLAPLAALPTDNYPENLQSKVKSLVAKIQNLKQSLKYMQHEAKKPVPLKMFEPKIEESWSGKKKKGGPNKKVNEKQRLTHIHKREMKAAIREIKRDNEVLARHKLDTIIQKDAERKRKYNVLMNDLQQQEGDFKKMKKEKYDS